MAAADRIVVDMLNRYEHEDAQPLRQAVRTDAALKMMALNMRAEITDTETALRTLMA